MRAPPALEPPLGSHGSPPVVVITVLVLEVICGVVISVDFVDVVSEVLGVVVVVIFGVVVVAVVVFGNPVVVWLVFEDPDADFEDVILDVGDLDDDDGYDTDGDFVVVFVDVNGGVDFAVDTGDDFGYVIVLDGVTPLYPVFSDVTTFVVGVTNDVVFGGVVLVVIVEVPPDPKAVDAPNGIAFFDIPDMLSELTPIAALPTS